MEAQEIVEVLRSSLINAKEVLEIINEIEKNIESISLNDQTSKTEILAKTKNLVDGLFEKSNKTKNSFYNRYNKIKNTNKANKSIDQSSSSEYEDASSHINDGHTKEINGEGTGNLKNDEINLDGVSKEIQNDNRKTSENNKHLNSCDANEHISGVTQSIQETNNLKVVYSNNTKKANQVDGENNKENEEESSKSNSDIEADCILETNDKTNNENDDCETVLKEAVKDNTNSEESDSVEQNADEAIEQGKDDAKELVEESGTTESATRDSIEENCNSTILEITEDEQNQEEIMINGDEEMSLVENESNNEEKDSSDGVETEIEHGSQDNNANENSKEASKKENSKSSKKENSKASKKENSKTSKNSETCSNKENSEEVNNKENCEEVNDKETSEGVNNKEKSDNSNDSVDLIVDTIKAENIEQNKENIEILPKIRLVSLDKLMEKPKRNVTFDSSIIILSSDEESIPEKRPNIHEENLSVDTGPTKEVPENTSSSKDQINSKKTEPDEDSTSMARKSTRIVSKMEEKQKERIKLKSIFTRTNANEWKGKSTTESNSNKEKSNKMKETIVDISDSSDDDCNKNKIKRGSKPKVRKSKKKEKDLYIPLPKIDCEKLEDVCSRDVNIFSTESILSRISKRGSKRQRKEVSENSSDSDKGKTKRKKDQIDGNAEISKSGEAVDSDETDCEDEQKNSMSSRKNKKEDCSGSEDESKVKKEDELQKNADSDSSDNEVKSEKVSKRVDISSSDSEEIKVKKKIKNEKHKKKKNIISDSEGEDQKDENTSGNDSSKSSDEKPGSDSESEKKKSSRRRVKRTKDSSESEEDISTRKQIRKVIGKDSLSETTKKAEAEEKERKARIAEKQKKYNAILGETKEATVEKVVLEIDEKTEKELLCVHPKLVEKLKPHQASGIRFMWDACFESLERAKKTAGSGCILAHCMGLGKTLQVIALTHTLLENSELTGVEKVLVVCPVSTVLNWKSEFKKWLPKKTHFEIFELVSCKQMRERKYRIGEWHEEGGVLIIGYTMFRNISNPDNKKIQKAIRETFVKGLVDPGPDLVVCDEGHLLKNEKTNLSIAMNRIKTSRRIVLTGTPLQNNLKEYWCMVQFIKPNLLGTYKEYLNRFVNPITNGQYTDSTEHDIVLMRKRAHVLHKLLDGVVQRRDYSVLEPYLPPKHEYVLFVRLSDVQVKLCQHYMDNHAQKRNGNRNVSFIFTDFQQFQRICTHPRVLLDKSTERREKLLDDEDSEGSLKDFIVNENVSSSKSSSSSSSSSSGSDSDSDTSNKNKNRKQQKTRMTRALAAKKRDNSDESDPEIIEVEQKEWWQDFCDGDELDNIQNSGKLSLLFHLLQECEEIGDKILIFSQSLYTLNCIEYFLEKIDDATSNGETEKFGGYSGTWHIGLDYFRLDGSSSCDNRALWCDMFNNTNNPRARLFLISTKAGGLGINLVAANRVVIFDVSWNPSHDIQSIYRVFRFGQTKPCYIYRFVTYGAMEMKIYERQVTKQAISKRVIDEQQIDRHYNQNDLQELYKSEYVPIEERPIPLVPKDVLLGEMIQKYDKIIYKYHEHQSLLENKEEECLNEEERKAAWDEFENEKVMRKTTNSGYGGMGLGMMGVNAPLIAMALANIVKRDNPTWSEIQVNGIIPALVQQLKVQLSENDTSMYIRVQQEIQRMQKEAREAEFQRQMRQMYAQTQYMQMAPQYLSTVRQMYDNMYNRPAFNPMASGSGIRHSAPTNDVIDLND